MPGVDLYYINTGNKFVITLEANTESSLTKLIERINAVEGVISTSMVYHHCESEQSLKQEISI